jgi:ribosome-associated translation inhibitor RaiA
MKITFTGKQDKLNPSEERKLAMAFAKLSKLLERRGEKGAQVILSAERHLKLAEVRVNFYDNALVGIGSGSSQFMAMMDAVEKVEKQALKTRGKWRDTKRSTPSRVTKPGAGLEQAEFLPESPVGGKAARKAARQAAKQAAKTPKPDRVVKAGGRGHGKPMTAEEAMMAFDDGQDYIVYRDTDSDKLSVLIRRRDGRVDLVEA